MLLLLAACVDPNRDPDRSGPIAWQECPLPREGKDKPLAQCATVDVPLRWEEPEGETIGLFVQRTLGREGRRQAWLLAGGPGQSGAVFETYVESLSKQDPTTDWYVADHRGTGESARLGCPEQEADRSDGGLTITADEWPDCLAAVEEEWGDGLQAFTASAAARDLEHLMTLADDGGDVFVYGGSYGTTLAHRFLQIFPDRVDGVVLDSVAVRVDHRVYDREFDQIGRDFLETACAEDDRCSRELGPDPYGEALDVARRVDEGHCAEAIDGDLLRSGAAAFLADATLRGFAPALFTRADRCSPSDRRNLERLIDLFTDREPHYTERLHGAVLFANIELSEQWPEPWPSLGALERDHHAAAFSFGIGPSQRPLLDLWPRYPLDEHAGGLADTATPILMLQGGLDPQTPPWRTTPLAEVWDGPGQHLVLFPTGTHLLLGSTPAPGGDCATRLVLDFLDRPLAEPDASCVDEVEGPDFTGQHVTSVVLLGDWSRWGGCGCASGGAGPWWLGGLLLLRRRR